jgi:RNA polymerase sigma factor (sigma-70 family)
MPTDSADEVLLEDEGGFTLYDVTEDESVVEPEVTLGNSHRDRLIELWLEQLTPKERDVVRLRFGLGEVHEPWTLEAIGQHMGVTRERIRQIQMIALKKLRAVAESEQIGVEEIL